MNRSRLTLPIAALPLAVALGAAVPRAALAQEVQVTGPLAGAPACRRCRIYREGRIQLQPFVGFTLQDEFSRTIFAGAQANYHLTDWLGIGVWGGAGVLHLDTGLTDQIADRGVSTARNRVSLPSADGFPDQIGRLRWVTALQASFIPLRGKLALFQKLFLDTDFYFFLGGAAIGVEERAATDVDTCPRPANPQEPNCLESQAARASRVAVAPTLGLGLMLYAAGMVGISVEWRFLPFAWNTSGTDERGGGPEGQFPDGVVDAEDQIFHVNHMINVGAAIYLPAEPRIGD